MKKLLISTTALSVAFSPLHTMPSMAQSLLDDGSVLSADGTLLCLSTPQVPCDFDAIMAMLKTSADPVAAEAAMAQAAAEAQAALAAQGAIEAQAAAEAQAAIDAQAAADAQAAIDAQAADAAAAQAAADAAAAQAAADAAAAQAAADADAAAAKAAGADADAEAQAAADADAEAQAAAAAQAALEAQAAAAADADAEAQAAAAAQAALDAQAAADADAAALAAQLEAEANAKAAASGDDTSSGVAEPQVTEPEKVIVAEEPVVPSVPVDTPVAEPQAVQALTDLLATPDAAVDALPSDGTTAPIASAAAAAFVADGGKQVTGQARNSDGDVSEPADATPAPTVVETVITEADTRSSDEEFTPVPTAVEGGRRSGLSDLEKVGLVALGALVIGAVLNDGKKVVQNSGDRVVVQNPDGRYVVYKDDDTLLRRPGVRTTTESFNDGSTRTIVQRDDGTQVVTVRDATGRVLRRSAYDARGVELVLIDDLQPEERIVIRDLPKPKPARVTISTSDRNAALKAELAALEAEDLGRKFSLRQIREIRQVRDLAATIEVDTITFDSGSSVIRATEARKLADLGRTMGDILDRNPGEVFLIEGHTDAVGSAPSNLALSDRRAESLALALTEYFEIPPENLVVQGYGEAELKVETLADERLNRRVAIRLITALMRQASN